MTRIFSILLASFLFANIILNINAQTAIPANVAQINTWFQSVIKPVRQQKTLLPNVVEAENGAPEKIEVRQDGSGKYRTIEDAIKHVKIGNTKRVIISIGPGEYREKIKIDRFKSYITLMASDPKKMPTITFAGTAAQYGTVDSATLIVEADYFVASNIIISNSAPRPNGKTKGAQATAIRISGDRAAFYNCRFLGFQDTVCDDKGNHLFKDCYIEGTVDFIYGAGNSLYLNCELHVIPGDGQAFIVAQARKSDAEQDGYSFVHCKITGTGGNAFLGRAWFEAAKAVYSYCEMSNAIIPQGWSDNNKPQVQKTVFFGEFENKGPGAALNKRVPYTKKLKAKEAATYISLEYIDGLKWLTPPPRI